MKRSLLSIICFLFGILSGAQDKYGLFPLDEAKAFVRNSYAPEVKYSDKGYILSSPNSLNPAHFNISWDNPIYALSADRKVAAYLLDFEPERWTIGYQFKGVDEEERKRAKEAGRQLCQKILIQKNLSTGRCFWYVMSLMPSAGLAPGSPFTGLVVYSGVNSQNNWIAKEYYKNGKFVYVRGGSKNDYYPDIRIETPLTYGNESAPIKDSDWGLIGANKCRVAEQLFVDDVPLDEIKAEVSSYQFFGRRNKDFVEKTAPATKPKASGKSAEVARPAKTMAGLNNFKKVIDTPVDVMHCSWNIDRNNGQVSDVRYKLIFELKDYCNYYVVRSSGDRFVVHPGKTEGTSLSANEYENERMAGLSFSYYRGAPIDTPDPSFPYALPIPVGTKTMLMQDKREAVRCFSVLSDEGTPVTAMRAGRVCSTHANDVLLIVHKDGTFAAYMNVTDVKVGEGESVEPGQVIAKSGAGKLSISVFYLDKGKVKTKGFPYTNITPCFRTEEGDVKPEERVEYTAKIDADLFSRDMSKAGRKKYLEKNK